MNRYAYLATGQMIALMESFSKIRVVKHGQESVPQGSIIFVVNHFTRIETLLLPYHIYRLTGIPVWSLASYTFFEGPLSGLLEKVGAVSTRDPDRDNLIVKSLLTGEANWIIFPEGRMVKDKEYAEEPRFFWSRKTGRKRPHSGAASLAIRTEFYRQRIRRLATELPQEVERLRDLFKIEDLCPVMGRTTWIVPVNMTYYPLRAKENLISRFAERLGRGLNTRLREELLTEGTMFFAGVDIDIRFGRPIDVRQCLSSAPIQQDLYSHTEINFNDRLPSRQAMRREATGLMRRYMAEIYSMTTVNHDHLFASLLNSFPLNSISEIGLRRRVFLLAAVALRQTGVCRHHSLDIGQVALLTDDRFHKYRDFRLLAEETKVLKREGGVLIKDPVKFTSSVDFHRIRVDNPLGVIANEVKPLEALQLQVRKMAWLPGMLIRKRVADYLLRFAEEEFEADYRSHSRLGESKHHDVGAPVLLKGKSRELGIVLYHGFLAAPAEMKELADYLNGKGYWVYLSRLRGHGTSPEDLAGRTGEDWIESADIGYALMSAICRRVVLGGFSFGGGIALDAAARIGGVAGVFAVCPPFRLQDLSSRLAPTVTAWNRVMDVLSYQGGKMEYVEIKPERPQINYARLPVAALGEMGRFMKALEPKLPAVTMPVLVVQAKGDPVVDPDGTRRFYNQIGSAIKEYRVFDFDRHGIVAGEGAGLIHKEIGDFVDRCRHTLPTDS